MPVKAIVAPVAQLTLQHLPLMEQFYTLQGEGAWAGTAAYFVRLAGCDVGCHWCDVKESWDEHAHPVMGVEEIALRAAQHGAQRVVITGGEPLLHDLKPLTTALKARGMFTHLETSGTQPLTGQLDWICLSPKKFKLPLPWAYASAQELKVIVHNQHDLLWAAQQAALCPASTQLFLQPEWGVAEAITPLIIAYIKKHPGWRLSLQTHKYIHIP